jgi:hypothetical protein
VTLYNISKEESKAENILFLRGYQIIGRGDGGGRPDFKCIRNGRVCWFEVKPLRARSLFFTARQMIYFHNSDRIMVFKRGALISEFIWKNRYRSTFRIKFSWSKMLVLLKEEQRITLEGEHKW